MGLNLSVAVKYQVEWEPVGFELCNLVDEFENLLSELGVSCVRHEESNLELEVDADEDNLQIIRDYAKSLLESPHCVHEMLSTYETVTNVQVADALQTILENYDKNDKSNVIHLYWR
jgi:DNA integrity scanning protein DisA with diadenylate cyclase activity